MDAMRYVLVSICPYKCCSFTNLVVSGCQKGQIVTSSLNADIKLLARSDLLCVCVEGNIITRFLVASLQQCIILSLSFEDKQFREL